MIKNETKLVYSFVNCKQLENVDDDAIELLDRLDWILWEGKCIPIPMNLSQIQGSKIVATKVVKTTSFVII